MWIFDKTYEVASNRHAHLEQHEAHNGRRTRQGSLTVLFEAHRGKMAGGVFEVMMLKGAGGK